MRILSLLLPVSVLIASAAEPRFVNEQYDLVKIADGTYSFIAPESDSGVVQSNCTLVIGDDAALVVDTGQFPSLAERMVADIKKLTNKPVRFVVNTHWHFDHMWGNATFRDAYPGAAIISTEFTRKMFEEEAPKVLAEQPAENEKQIKQYRAMAAADKLPDGRPMTADIARSLRRLADTLEHIAQEFPYTLNVSPVIGFEKELTVNLGKREVKVMWLGRANTGGDAVVWVPDIRLLVAGDTVVMPTPFAFGSYMTEWPVTLQKMLDLNPGVIIPGHGPVQPDTSYVKTLIAMFQALNLQVKQAVDKGETLKAIEGAVKLEEFRQRLAGDNAMRNLGFQGAFLQPAIERAYQEATGALKPESAQ